MQGCFKFAYEAANQKVPNWTVQNQGMNLQTVMWDLHSSEILCSAEQ